MAQQTNYRLAVPPFKWNSAYHPIRFIYDMPTESCIVQDSISGFVEVICGYFMGTIGAISVGDLIYITTGAYKGLHVVSAITDLGGSYILGTNTLVKTVTTYGSEAKLAQPQVFSIYKGIVGDPNMPYSKVSDLQVECNTEGYIEFDVQGYVQASLNPIIPPLEGTLSSGYYEYIDYSLFIPFSIRRTGDEDGPFYGAQCGITSERLNAEFLGTDKPLMDYSFEYINGNTFKSYLLDNNTIITKRKDG